MLEYLNFATNAASGVERSHQWLSVTKADFAELHEDREASIRGCDLGQVRICRVAMGRHAIESEPRFRLSDDHNLVKILFQEEGACQVEQAGFRVSLQAGQWCAIDKAKAFRVEAVDPCRQLALALPAKLIREWGLSDRQIGAQGFLQGVTHVLHSSAAAALLAALHLGRRDRAGLGEALIAMINMVWAADPDACGAGVATRRRLAVMDYVERNLADPELNVAKIASELGLAKRTLHKLFAENSITISKLIWERRLEHCRQNLIDPVLARHSITDIAYDCGFNDSQHFSRAFKAKYGQSPRSFRTSHLVH